VARAGRVGEAVDFLSILSVETAPGLVRVVDPDQLASIVRAFVI
jgi:hypothetical protein